MKGLVALLVVLLLMFQYKLWFAKGGVVELWQLKEQIDLQQQQNDALKTQNLALEAEVDDLKHGTEAVEEHARHDLGLVKEGEAFYQVTTSSR